MFWCNNAFSTKQRRFARYVIVHDQVVCNSVT